MMSQLISRIAATIANGAYLSGAVQFNGRNISVIEMSAGWTLAVLTFQVSYDGTNYYNLYDDNGDEVIVIVEAARRVHISIDALEQHKYIKIRSGTSVTTVAQGAERVLYVEVWT